MEPTKDPNLANPETQQMQDLLDKINDLSCGDNQIDPNCYVLVKRKLVRVEYPGLVKNIDKALETMGGIENLENIIAERAKGLEVNFHPKNKFNKPCCADKDTKPGILLKVKKPPPNTEVSDLDVEIEGVSVMNFTFNGRLCDFQYLPLVAEQPETKESKTENQYARIIPTDDIPSHDWLSNEDAKNMELFLVPANFSGHDNAQRLADLDQIDEPSLKPPSIQNKQKKKLRGIFGKSRARISFFAKFDDRDLPTQPTSEALKLLTPLLEERLERVKQLFEERPIWTKAAIRYNTGLTPEHAKIILPLVAYYFSNGPWRISWVKFGYDPRTDPSARIYQTVDYRIRMAEGTKMKVNPKRRYMARTSVLGPSFVKKVSLKDDIGAKPNPDLDERCYVVRPMVIPPARQMFYQLCDLLLPEIQDKISKLPRNVSTVCHLKNGFLPETFLDKCRNIVNDHVQEAVQKEFYADRKAQLEKESKEKTPKSIRTELDYYNQMLEAVKTKNFGASTSFMGRELEDDVEQIDLSSDEEYILGDLYESIPEKIDEDSDSSDGEIDLEAVEEINQLINSK